jgi:hypothetical protein
MTLADVARAVTRRPTRRGTLLELRGRPSAEGTRPFFANLHGLMRAGPRGPFGSPSWLGVEIVRCNGALRYQVWVPDRERDLVTRLLRACYQELELVPLPSTSFAHPVVAVMQVGLAFGPYLPLRSAPAAEALSGLLAMLALAGADQEILVQLLLSPSVAWQRAANNEAYRLRTPGARGGARARAARTSDRALARDIETRAKSLGYDCVLRIAAGASSPTAARELLRAIVATYGVYQGANGFLPRWVRINRTAERDVVQRAFPRFGSINLTSEELAHLWHLPTAEPPQLRTAHPMHVPPPAGADAGDRIIGTSTWPGDARRIGLTIADSRLHLHLLGPTGTGKTTAMLNLAEQDIAAGRGVGVLDPKGDLVAALLERIPASRWDDVVYISPDQDARCVGIHPLELSADEDPDLVCENTLTIFKRLYERYWGMRTDDILKVALRTMLLRDCATLAHIPLLLTDATFREQATRAVGDAFLMSFWQWYESLSEARRTEAIGPVLNKLRDFLVRPRLRRLLCQVRSTVRLRDVVDRRKILLADLSIGRWGESAAELAGSFLMAALWQAVLARSSDAEAERTDFFLYVDEFHKFQGVAMPFGDALAQARSLRLVLTLANQNLGQLSKELRDAIAANARSRLVFQCSQEDAVYLARTFTPLDASALESLPRFEMAVRLAIGGATSPGFTLRTAPPSAAAYGASASSLRIASLARYGRSREEVDREILATIHWMGGAPSKGLEG